MLDRAEALVDRVPAGVRRNDLRGQIAVLRGTYEQLNRGDFEGAVSASATARELLAPGGSRTIAYSYALGAMALANSGRHTEARRLVDSVVGDERFSDWPIDPMIWTRPLLAWVEGDLPMLDRTASQLLVAGERFEQRALVAYAHYFLGIGAYERDDLATAEDHLTRSVDIDYAIIEVFLHGSVALALTQHASGRSDRALDSCGSMVGAMLTSRGDYNVPTAEAAMALLELRTGRRSSALRWARAAEPDVARHRYMFFDLYPALIEILMSSVDDIDRGRELLAVQLASPYGRFNGPVNIKLLGLAAIDACHTDEHERALKTLARAVRRATEGGMVRSLADLGPELVPILHQLDVTGAELDHVGAILRAIEAQLYDGAADLPVAQIPAAVSGELGPGLTEREVDVLALLARRFSNKEISRELLIAPATVKKHTVTLYQKLNVHGRREAVDKARALGYITG